MVNADIHILHSSDCFQILDFRCHCTTCSITQPEYNGSFCVSFVKSGYFEYRVFNNGLEAHVGRILLSRPGFEHITRHIDNRPDNNTIFEFRPEFYLLLKDEYRPGGGWFLENPDIHAILLNSTPELECLHDTILRRITENDQDHLLVDNMVFGLLDKIMLLLCGKKTADPLPEGLKKYHLATMEKARAFILDHFRENITLQHLAGHCLVSPFHFSRLFRQFSNCSPYQYLVTVRLQHARILLETTRLPVGEIAFGCGFNSLEHFVTSFRQKYSVSPGAYRKQIA
jgi:AraC-like DNA-binding protein